MYFFTEKVTICKLEEKAHVAKAEIEVVHVLEEVNCKPPELKVNTTDPLFGSNEIVFIEKV